MNAPDYQTHAPKGWAGDPSRGAALGRPDTVETGAVIYERARVLRKQLGARREALANYQALPRLPWAREAVPSVADEIARLESELATLAPALAIPVKVTLRRVRLDSGGYDSAGSYWGRGAPLYWASTDSGEWESTFRAHSRNAAKDIVRDTIPAARFYS